MKVKIDFTHILSCREEEGRLGTPYVATTHHGEALCVFSHLLDADHFADAERASGGEGWSVDKVDHNGLRSLLEQWQQRVPLVAISPRRESLPSALTVPMQRLLEAINRGESEFEIPDLW